MSNSIKNTPAFALYIHIPFCKHRCGYCDFATFEDQHHLIDDYVNVLLDEINYYGQNGYLSDLKTIFFGGGTPSQMNATHFEKILNEVYKFSSADSNIDELTVEVNPDDATLKFLSALQSLGVNRISMGVQSFDNEVLHTLERTHKKENVLEAAKILNDLNMNFSVDLIYGTPFESLESWRKTVEKVVNLQPKHLSLYCLSIEGGTPMGKLLSTGQLKDVDIDLANEKYFLADEILQQSGFEWYEISNWSKPGFESQHNLAYWKLKPYVGVGLSAHGYLGSKRYKNSVSLTRYMDDFQKSKTQYTSELHNGELAPEGINSEDVNSEQVMLGLRLKEGISLELLDGLNSFQLGLLLKEKVLLKKDNNVLINPDYRLVAHDVIARLIN